MDHASGRPEIFIPVGAVCFVGGIGIVVNGLSISPASWPVIVLGGVIFFLGTWAFIAPFNERMWLPGRREIRQRVQRETQEADNRTKRTQEAIEFLWAFHATCLFARDSESVTDEMFVRWTTQLGAFIDRAWGPHERSGVLGGIMNGGNFYRFAEIESRIFRLIERAANLEVRSTFSVEDLATPEWMFTEARSIPDPETTSIFGPPPHPTTEV